MDTMSRFPHQDRVAQIWDLIHRFTGCRGLRIRNSPAVHMITAVESDDGYTVPMPYCHTGSFGWDPEDFRQVPAGPTRDNLCGNCRRKWERANPNLTLALPVGSSQLTLWVA